MLTEFVPARYALGEWAWLKDKLGKPPAVVFADPLPPRVNPNAVKPLIESIYSLMQLQEHRGENWVGITALRELIDRYLGEYAKWQEYHKRGAPRFPTLFMWDASGKPHG